MRPQSSSRGAVFSLIPWQSALIILISAVTPIVLSQPTLAPAAAYAAGLPFKVELRIASDAAEVLSHEDRIRVVDASVVCGSVGSGTSQSSTRLRGSLAEDPHRPGEAGRAGATELSLSWPDLRLMQAGNYQVCLCRNRGASCVTDVLFAQSVGVFMVSGPTSISNGASSALSPTAGRMFNIQVQGLSLSSRDRLHVVDQQFACGSTAAAQNSASLMESGLDLPGHIGMTGNGLSSQVWSSLVLVLPGAYNVCWCSSLSATCASGGNFNVLAGVITVLGPLRLEVPGGNVSIGADFTLSVVGTGLSQGDRIRLIPGHLSCGLPGASVVLATALTNTGVLTARGSEQELQWRRLQLSTGMVYKVCWCAMLAEDCASDFDFIVNAGSFRVVDGLVMTSPPAVGVVAVDGNQSVPCVDELSWQSSYGANCAWFAENDPGCTKTADIGQLEHCNSTCQTCPARADPLVTSCSLGALCACFEGCSPSVPCPVGVMGGNPARWANGSLLTEECYEEVIAVNSSSAWKTSRPTNETPWHEWQLPAIEEIHGFELHGDATSENHTTTFSVQVLLGNHSWRTVEDSRPLAANWDGHHSVRALFASGPVQTRGLRLEPRDFAGSPTLSAALVVRRCTINTAPSPDWRCHALKCQAFCYRQLGCTGQWFEYCQDQKQASLAWEFNAATCDVDCSPAYRRCRPSFFFLLTLLLACVCLAPKLRIASPRC